MIPDNLNDAKVLYLEMLKTITNTKNSVMNGNLINISPILPLTKKIIDFMSTSKDLNYYSVNYYDTEDLFISHSANVTIFSIIMGKGFNYSKDQLIILGTAALIHDIGLTKMPNNILQKDKTELTAGEKKLLEKHPIFIYDLIEKDTPRAKRIATAALQHQEKSNGTGYPNQLEEENITRDGQILSIIDTYEALIHPRSKRDSLVPPNGINQILSNDGSSFSRIMLRTLLEQISIYPIGMYVKLCSNEIAKVLEINKRNPMRPIVEIQYNSKREKIEPREINLLNESQLYIERCVPMRKTKPIKPLL